MKTKIAVAISVLVVMGLFGFFSYRAGLAASQKMNIVTLLLAIQMQHKCIENGDMKCLRATNQLLVTSAAAQTKALLDSGMPHTLGKEGEEFISWAQSVSERE